MRHVAFPHPKRAIASLDPPAADTIDSYVIDLTAFDSAFHALFASEEAGVADMPMKPYLPIRFGCVRAFAPGKAAAVAVARTLRQSPTLLAHRHRIVRCRRQAHPYRRGRAARRCARRDDGECPVAHLSHDGLATRPRRRTDGPRLHFKRRLGVARQHRGVRRGPALAGSRLSLRHMEAHLSPRVSLAPCGRGKPVTSPSAADWAAYLAPRLCSGISSIAASPSSAMASGALPVPANSRTSRRS